MCEHSDLPLSPFCKTPFHVLKLEPHSVKRRIDAGYLDMKSHVKRNLPNLHQSRSLVCYGASKVAISEVKHCLSYILVRIDCLLSKVDLNRGKMYETSKETDIMLGREKTEP